MRSAVPFWNWWNTGPCSSVAVYSSTGTDTSPNDNTPDQTARAIRPASAAGLDGDVTPDDSLHGRAPSSGELSHLPVQPKPGRCQVRCGPVRVSRSGQASG